ncbi:TlpA family protein disulfide reductase [Leucobacter sp. gxy201]|uniref:TlpA family protein disulfide reductase n=1 Tax=Leucobacter sp. gxy201 TaxID=2957200 RepID=UPI003D9FCF86
MRSLFPASTGIAPRRRAYMRVAACIAALGLAFGATACSSAGADDLSQQWEDGGDKGFISGDGSSLSIPVSERTEPVEFSGATEDGSTFGTDDIAGRVTVVNFWYAGCPPCRAEAPDLVEVYDEFAPQGVAFVGVNTRDQVAQAQQFSEQFGIEYPSIMDVAGDREVQRAFAGQVPLNAVPTTLVLDAQGRVAHRVLGQLAAASQLRTLVEETLAETGAEQ